MAGPVRRLGPVRSRRHGRVLLADAAGLFERDPHRGGTCRGKVPILAGAGGPTRVAIEYAKEAERLGAHGILLMPHYLTEASEEGIANHIEEVCKATKCGLIVYNRANSRIGADLLERVVDRCPNLIGFKDGVGEIEAMVRVRRKLGDRLAYLAACPPPRSTPLPTRRWACRCTRRPCSTSSRRRRWTSTAPSRRTTTLPWVA